MAATTTTQLERELAAVRADLDAWLDEQLSPGEPRVYNGELEAGYPEWDPIVAIVGRIYAGDHLRHLSPTAVENLMFCFSRAVECMSFVNWLSPQGRMLSYIGPLGEDDFLRLCEMSLSLPEDASDFQLAACFENLESARPELIEILLRFFARKDPYTRRRALHSLTHFKYEHLGALVDELWKEDDEFAKLSCLHCLSKIAPNSPQFVRLLDEYRRLYDVDQEDYRKAHMERLLA